MSKEKDGDGYITFRDFRDLADKLVLEAEGRADKVHAELKALIVENRDNVRRLEGIFEGSLAERRTKEIADSTITGDYRVDTERRISKLEANQYVQVALLVVTIIASVVGLFKLFVH